MNSRKLPCSGATKTRRRTDPLQRGGIIAMQRFGGCSHHYIFGQDIDFLT
jgi:hypothetical protein